MRTGTSRRGFLATGGAAALGLAAGPLARLVAAPSFDLVIRGGTIVDGTGGAPWAADVGISGDTLTALGTIDAEQARRVIDADGLTVVPGFIDIHSHSDDSIVRYPDAQSRVLQGVTTEVTGNCGYSAAPLGGVSESRRRAEFRTTYGVEASWSDVASYLRALEETEIAVNQALLLGQGSLRENTIGGEDRGLTEDESRALMRAVEAGMDEGAYGLSTGLEYAPGIFTPTAEIAAMATVVARRGGLYASHIRNEVAAVLAAVAEAIEIGRRSGARVQISHLKAVGSPNWPKQEPALSLIESARAGGVEVLADAYPYSAYSTGLSVLTPAWARDGGRPALLARLRETDDRRRIRAAIVETVRQDPGAFELIVISSVGSEANRPLVGRNLVEIADAWGTEPAEALLELLIAEDGDVGYVGHGMSEENVERVLAHPLVMIGSDGVSIAPEGPAAATRPHPRSYGTYPRVLGHYRRERGLFDLPTAIRKMTSLPADQVGLPDRGRLARGKKADLVIFDAAKIADQATFEDPHRYPTGIRHVLVNGVPVVENAAPTGRRPGRVLRKS
jgi:N-acyl-D-amino-acid deacylase